MKDVSPNVTLSSAVLVCSCKSKTCQVSLAFLCLNNRSADQLNMALIEYMEIFCVDYMYL